MRKRLIPVLILLAWAAQIAAQKPAKMTYTRTDGPKVIIPYLGHSDYRGGMIPKTVFDSLLKQGLTAKDSIGKAYKVSEFTFSYAERNLYEDSVGNLMYLTDFFSEYCPGDTVNLGIARNIYYKTKPGDTAYFDNIKVADGNRQLLTKSGMRFVLTR